MKEALENMLTRCPKDGDYHWIDSESVDQILALFVKTVENYKPEAYTGENAEQEKYYNAGQWNIYNTLIKAIKGESASDTDVTHKGDDK